MATPGNMRSIEHRWSSTDTAKKPQNTREGRKAARMSVASAPGYPYRREPVVPEGDALCGAVRSSKGHAQSRQAATSRSKGSSRCPTPAGAPSQSIPQTERRRPTNAGAGASARYSAPPGVYYLVPFQETDEIRRPARTKRPPPAPLGYSARAERSVTTQDHDQRKSTALKEAGIPEGRIQVTVETAVDEEHLEPTRLPAAVHLKTMHSLVAGWPQHEAASTLNLQDIESQSQRSEPFHTRVLSKTKLMFTGVARESLDLLTAKRDEGRPWWKPKPALLWTLLIIAMATFAIAYSLAKDD